MGITILAFGIAAIIAVIAGNKIGQAIDTWLDNHFPNISE